VSKASKKDDKAGLALAREALTLPTDRLDAMSAGLSGGGLSLSEEGLTLDESEAPDPDDPLAGLNADNNAKSTEDGMAADLEVIESAFAKRGKHDLKRFELVTDTEYWFALHFDTREQKEAFLKVLGWDSLDSDKYLDGVELARRLGIPLPPTPPELSFAREKSDPKLSGLTL
jgi:hypothetical protein